MTAVLSAERLGKRFGRHWALRELSLELPPGRIVALVGPNGAGKTTFLLLAMGLLQSTEGRIGVFGQSPRDDAGAILPRVGYAFQDPPLFRRFSVSDLLTMGSRLNPVWDRELALSRLTALGIPLAKRAGELSGGMRAQVALVLALAKRPKLLLLDEPMASLDPLARNDFMRLLMGATADQGLTVVLSSHIIGDLTTSCDYLVLLTGGESRLIGDMDAIIGRHRRLIGPIEALASARRHDIVHSEFGDRQANLLVALSGSLLDARWRQLPVTLEEIVVAYLTRSRDRAERRGVVELVS